MFRALDLKRVVVLVGASFLVAAAGPGKLLAQSSEQQELLQSAKRIDADSMSFSRIEGDIPEASGHERAHLVAYLSGNVVRLIQHVTRYETQRYESRYYYDEGGDPILGVLLSSSDAGKEPAVYTFLKLNTSGMYDESGAWLPIPEPSATERVTEDLTTAQYFQESLPRIVSSVDSMVVVDVEPEEALSASPTDNSVATAAIALKAPPLAANHPNNSPWLVYALMLAFLALVAVVLYKRVTLGTTRPRIALAAGAVCILVMLTAMTSIARGHADQKVIASAVSDSRMTCADNPESYDCLFVRQYDACRSGAADQCNGLPYFFVRSDHWFLIIRDDARLAMALVRARCSYALDASGCKEIPDDLRLALKGGRGNTSSSPPPSSNVEAEQFSYEGTFTASGGWYIEVQGRSMDLHTPEGTLMCSALLNPQPNGQTPYAAIVLFACPNLPPMSGAQQATYRPDEGDWLLSSGGSPDQYRRN